MPTSSRNTDQMKPHPVDFHCHLDLHKDMRAAFKRCDGLRCITLSVTTTPKAFERNREFSEQTKHVHAALGLHPQLAAKRGHEIELFENLLATTRFVGEVGLDAGRRHYSSFKLQKEIFARILNACREQGSKVISVHSVRCGKQVLDMIEKSRANSNCYVVLHWFSASRPLIERAVELNCFFSINEALVGTLNGHNILELAPMDRILTETDAPFLRRNRRAVEACDVGRTVLLIAGLLGKHPEDVANKIEQNAQKLLRQSQVGIE